MFLCAPFSVWLCRTMICAQLGAFVPLEAQFPAPPAVTGELKQWHKVSITFSGPWVCEKFTPNPFMDYRLNVTFRQGERSYLAPGYYAADGVAAETSGECGNKWRVHFVPDQTGAWEYSVSFRQGPEVAVSLDAAAGAPLRFDGASGRFAIGPSDKTGRDHRAKGMLRYVGEHYPRYAGSGEYFLQMGSQSPENFLAYFEFDNTEDHGGPPNRLADGLHHYEPHAADWRPGDPTWQGGKGKAIIGALNYLASKGMNTFYSLTMNVEGDGREIYPWVSYSHRNRYDVSKLDQWEIVFSHMDTLGLQLHVITQEEEGEEFLGKMTADRKLYYRELAARFSHHHALLWDLDEEMDRWNYFTAEDIRQMAEYMKAVDPYDHPIQYVQWKAELMEDERTYGRLLGFPHFDGVSLQHDIGSTHAETLRWRDKSAAAGHKWLTGVIEINPTPTGVVPDADDYWHDDIRKHAVWGNLMAGGFGTIFFFGYRYPNSDLDCEDWRSRDHLWDLMRHAHEFFTRYLPFAEMNHDDGLISAAGAHVFAKRGEVYAVYLPQGGAAELDLNGVEGNFDVRWHDPRTGGELQRGSVPTISGGGKRALGAPPQAPGQDWAVLVGGARR
jgi:hypothetical protein